MIISALQATTLEQQAAALNQEMNHCVTDWDMDDDTRLFPDLPTGDWDSSQPKKSLGLDDDLVELLWRNGQVVYSQTNRKSSFPSKDPKPVNTKPEQSVKSGFLGFITDISGLTNQNPIQEDVRTCIDISGLTNQNLIQEDVTTSFLHYPLDDSLGNEFCSDFFYEMPISDPIGIEKPNKKFGENSVKISSSEAATNKHRPERRPRSVFKRSNNPIDIEKPNNEVGGVNSVKIDPSEAATNKQGNERRPRSVFKQSNNLHIPENLIHKSQSLMPPPEVQISETISQAPSPNLVRTVNFPHFSGPGMTPKTDLGSASKPIGQNGSRKLLQVEVGESSMMTIGLSNCGSNQVENQSNLFSFSSNYGNTGISAEAVTETARNTTGQSDRGETIEPTVTSSSGGSAISAGRIAKQISMNQRNKRKGRDAAESEFQSEETEDESVEANKPAQRSASARRSRAAEVHNLSERRRRDRINEKMKALQELIPHSNKSDKASMLDEAIEYLKSLQLQVQIMWMGGGMFPVMFPGAQHYMPPLGVRPAPLPSVNGPSGAPNQLPLCVPPALNPVNFQNQIRNSNFPEAYRHFLNFHHLQTSPQMVQQNHMAIQPNSSSGPCIRGVLSKDIQCGKLG